MGKRSSRGLIALVAAAAALVASQAAVGSAQAATTVAVAPASSTCCISNPFGETNIWAPTTVFVYKDIPAFSLRPGDTIDFDLTSTNDIDIQLQIDLAPATTNGGNQNAGSFTQVVPNSQLPASPRGDTVAGDYELRFTATAPFDFPGGGLLIRFSHPGGAFAGDLDAGGSGVAPYAGPSDSSGHFVEEEIRDPDGVYPWTGDTYPFISGFRLDIADVPPTPPAGPGTPRKNCKKRHHRSVVSAKKKCKKKRR